MGASAFSGTFKYLFRGKSPTPANGAAAGVYTSLDFDDAAIARGDYKRHLGGGSKGWDSRGQFQLDFLRARGLVPTSTLLDIGCGPLRAGVHFIRYLNAGNYYGFDYNASFVTAAEQSIAQNEDLAAKAPTVVTLANFDLCGVQRLFDYAIAFSVLNHSSDDQRRRFFANIGRCLKPGAKLVISHAGFLKKADLSGSGLAIARCFEPKDLELSRYGWTPREQRSVCPIYELEREGR